MPFPLSLLLLVPLAASLALQIAAIKAQKFDKGGWTGSGSSHRDETGKRVAGIVHENEYVAPDHQIDRHPNLFHWLNSERQRPGLKAPDSVSAIYGDRLKRYAEGGFTAPISRSGSNTGNSNMITNANFTDEQIGFLARQIALATMEGTKQGVGEGLDNANREGERKRRLKEKLTA